MKQTFIAFGLILAVNAFADIEFSPGEQVRATPQEIAKSRSCFEELNVQGCGDPGEDIHHFRSCLKNVHSTLTADCKKMMTDLYGVK